MKKIVVIEPYYGGSHKAFLDQLKSQLPCELAFYTLPARQWKWRMRMAAPFFAGKVGSEIEMNGVDAFLCSPFLDVAVFRGMLPAPYRSIPIYTYFHENQFAYPVQVKNERDFHFSLINLTTALASDFLAFNSNFNLDSFLAGFLKAHKKKYDMALEGVEASIRLKSTILYPGLDFTAIDSLPERVRAKTSTPPLIVWNHRWEHDKNPELFFQTLYDLQERGVEFSLVVVGESFHRKPSIFEEAQRKLSDRIVQFGYLPKREDYLQWLKKADVVVSTAKHEFYGIAVIEAVRAGCRPVLPARLSYPELFPEEFLYEDNNLFNKLISCLRKPRLAKERAIKLTKSYSWETLQKDYIKWLNL